MRHLIFEESDRHQIALLIKSTAFKQHDLQINYVQPLNTRGIETKSLIAFTLETDEHNKLPVKYAKAYLDSLLPALDSCGVQILYVAEPTYFKLLTKQSKADPHFGYVLPCKYPGYEHFQVVLGLNHQALIYNPELQAKLDLSLNTLASVVKDAYVALGSGIIHSAQYPQTHQEITQALQSLHQYKSLTCDIEAFSLRFNEAGIATIAFAWDKHNGLSFPVDYQEYLEPPSEMFHGFQGENHEIRLLIRRFFEEYKGTIIWHNSAYDLKVLIYTLWMKNLLDTHGLLTGLDVLTKSFQDTMIIAYLATNSTAGNVLGLKPLAHEFAGNWAVEDIKDVRLIPLKELLQYNLVDALSTWYVYDKYTPIMEQDNQSDLYYSLMLPSLKLIIQMELSGMPMCPQRILEVKESLTNQANEHLAMLENNPVIKMLNLVIQTDAMEAANAKLKTKQHPLSKFAGIKFNPHSPLQLQKLLHKQMGLPVLDYTDTKQPATGADTIEKLINHTQVPEYKEILQTLISYGKISKIIGTFIPAFERGIHKDDGRQYLHGSFNLGGTVSGRLSSSDPNMQNLPANSTYGKLIKTCFQAPEGWVFAGADFNSLEDYVSALTTKDPNKLKVYTEGYDGHCLRAFSYFRDKCPDIEDTVDSINSMKKRYPELRQDSKGPTFALTYQGTWHTLVNNLGFAEEKAKEIEKGYHDLYQVSDEYVQNRLKQASDTGYVEVAFGLRVRTPLLKQVVFGSSRVPYEAAAEGRTAGNAMGQSYGLLNNRAAVDFMQKVWASPYRLDIKPVALIHDAIYIVIRDDVRVVEWANRELIKSMQWQELPELQHDVVKLGAALDIFWPDWAHPITLPNDSDQTAILRICHEAKEELLKAS